MQVVPARYEHLPVLTLLYRRLLAERGEHYPVIDEEEFERFTLLMAGRIDEGDARACCLVAEHEGKLLGFVACQLGERQVGKPRVFCFMEWIGVAPGARKLGVGRGLVEAAVAWAEARGVGVIEGNIAPGPAAGWAAGATDYARRQVITIAEARASVLVPKDARPPVGATHDPEPPKPLTKTQRRLRKAAKPRQPNGHALPEESLP